MVELVSISEDNYYRVTCSGSVINECFSAQNLPKCSNYNELNGCTGLSSASQLYNAVKSSEVAVTASYQSLLTTISEERTDNANFLDKFKQGNTNSNAPAKVNCDSANPMVQQPSGILAEHNLNDLLFFFSPERDGYPRNMAFIIGSRTPRGQFSRSIGTSIQRFPSSSNQLNSHLLEVTFEYAGNNIDIDNFSISGEDLDTQLKATGLAKSHCSSRFATFENRMGTRRLLSSSKPTILTNLPKPPKSLPSSPLKLRPPLSIKLSSWWKVDNSVGNP
ncbi:hypothetical protein GIB67_033485 [Kingdonia uniflora]|uniref:Uncharacterized protein n=1 Tax=Kingdonia uniflora TaxID=39325 RepID=A0A7J7L606_9MAGN|nr:hypothetical protein GIB67_033485 [Kingdonia uniflora]